MDINFEDYDIIKIKQIIYELLLKKNNIIDFIKEIKQNYSISLITNNDTNQIIKNSIKINIKTNNLMQ